MEPSPDEYASKINSQADDLSDPTVAAALDRSRTAQGMSTGTLPAIMDGLYDEGHKILVQIRDAVGAGGDAGFPEVIDAINAASEANSAKLDQLIALVGASSRAVPPMVLRLGIAEDRSSGTSGNMVWRMQFTSVTIDGINRALDYLEPIYAKERTMTLPGIFFTGPYIQNIYANGQRPSPTEDSKYVWILIKDWSDRINGGGSVRVMARHFNQRHVRDPLDSSFTAYVNDCSWASVPLNEIEVFCDGPGAQVTVAPVVCGRMLWPPA